MVGDGFYFDRRRSNDLHRMVSMGIDSYDLIEGEEMVEMDFGGDDDKAIDYYSKYYSDIMTDEDIEDLEIQYGKC